MPQIPTAITPREFPIPTVSPQMEGAPWGAVAQAGEQLERLGSFGEEVAKRVQNAQDRVGLSKLHTDLLNELEQRAEKYRNRTDYESFESERKVDEESIREKFQNVNPRLQGTFNPFMEYHLNTFNRAVRLRQVEEVQREAKYQVGLEKERAMKDMAEEPDPDKRAIRANEFNITLQDYVSSNLLTREQAHGIAEDIEMHGERARLVNGTRSNEPVDLVHILDEIKQHKFPNLESKHPEAIAAFEVHAKNKLESLQNKLQKKEDDLAINGAIVNVEKSGLSPKDNRLDFGVMHSLLSNKDFLKDNNLLDENGNPDRKRVDAVQTHINALETQHLHQVNEASKKVGGQIMDALDKNNIPGALDIWRGNKDVLVESGHDATWKHVIDGVVRGKHTDERERRTEAREARMLEKLAKQEKSDEMFGSLMKDMFVDHKVLDPMKDIYPLMTKGLSWQRANEAATLAGEKKDPDFALGVAIINDALKNRIIDGPAAGKAMIDLHDAVKKDGLRGKDIIDKANAIVHPKTESWLGGLFDKILGFGKETPAPQSAPTVVRTGKEKGTGKTVEQLSDGTMRYAP